MAAAPPSGSNSIVNILALRETLDIPEFAAKIFTDAEEAEEIVLKCDWVSVKFFVKFGNKVQGLEIDYADQRIKFKDIKLLGEQFPQVTRVIINNGLIEASEAEVANFGAILQDYFPLARGDGYFYIESELAFLAANKESAFDALSTLRGGLGSLKVDGEDTSLNHVPIHRRNNPDESKENE